MSNLYVYTPPAHHYASPLTRSRSDLRTSKGISGLRRSHSYTHSSCQSFTRPSYGYGGGFMSRSLSRSNSGTSLFGRSLNATALCNTPPFHNVAVQRSTPHYSDKYPYVRYSYGNIETGLATLTATELKSPDIYGIRDLGTKRWLEGKLNAYNTGLFNRPNYKSYVERPIAPVRSYVRYMPVEDATDLFKKKCMTSGTLSKYWLSPSTFASRRDRELNPGMASHYRSMSSSAYSTSSRSGRRTDYYSKVVSRLGS